MEKRQKSFKFNEINFRYNLNKSMFMKITELGEELHIRILKCTGCDQVSEKVIIKKNYTGLVYVNNNGEIDLV